MQHGKAERARNKQQPHNIRILLDRPYVFCMSLQESAQVSFLRKEGEIK